MGKIVIILMAFLVVSGCNKSKNSTTELTGVAKFEVLLKKAPSYENYINYGLELAKVNRHQEALTAYRKASEINPNAPLAWNNICADLNQQKRFVEALPNCEKALSLEPKFVLAKNNLKISKTKIEELRKSLVQRKRELLGGANLSAQALLDIGMQFYSVKELDTSIEAWSKVKNDHKLFAMAQNNIASSYLIMGQLRKAERALNKALVLEPNNRLFTNNKKWLENEKAAKK